MYATVLLPLALQGTFTYLLSPALADRVGVGSRVVVQFGPRRYYTAIVTALSETPPDPSLKLKEITEVAGEGPVVLPAQLRLWRWMAQYYLCAEGEVMKAALPAGLKLESETQLVRLADFDADEAELPEAERALLAALDTEKGKTLAAVEKELARGRLMAPLRRLMAAGAVGVKETLTGGFRPRTETRVALTPQYFSEPALNRLFDTLKRAPAQEALLLRYLDLAGASTALTLRNEALLQPVEKRSLTEEGRQDSALAALRQKGVLRTFPVEVARLRPALTAEQTAGTALAAGVPKPLGPQQARALGEVKAALREKQVCLLHGVTSSGKTEVYIHLIREMLAAGRQVLYLLPEIALTTQITTRLARVFGEEMAVYHSKFPDAERVELWQRQLGPKAAGLVLGVRSAVFLPFRRLGLVIVDEEHETSFKQQDPAPRYQGRDTAIVLAAQAGAKVVLGTATPSLETYRHALEGKYALVEMKQRFGEVMLPEIVVEDVKELRRKKLMPTPFSPRLIDEVRAALAAGEQAILFLNRRGYAPMVECRQCGWTPRCTRCDVSLTLHRRMDKLVCHYCGAIYDIPSVCPACEGHDLRDMGYGTERIEEAAEKVFPEARIARMDLDSTRSRTAYEDLIGAFQRGEKNLLIGTQMVTKGLDFDRVRVVGILNADQMMNMADFRAHERAFQLMAQVAGRAGRRSGRGLVVLQTRQPQLPLVRQVVADDYRAMYADQWAERRDFRFPPAVRLINIFLKHKDEQVVAHAAEQMAQWLRPHFGTDLLGPNRPIVARVQLLHLRQMMLKIDPKWSPASVRRTLSEARTALGAIAAYKGVVVVYDVDP